MMKTALSLAILGASLTFGTCAQAQFWASKDVTYNARIGAKYPIGAAGETVGVAAFDGQDGNEFAVVLEATLNSAELDGTPLLNMTAGPAQVVLRGAVLRSQVNLTRYTEERRDCVDWKGFLNCKQWQTRTVSCEKTNGSYSVSAGAQRVQDRKMIFSQNISFTGEYKECEGQGNRPEYAGPPIASPYSGDVSSPAEMLGVLRTLASLKVRELVAPHNKLIKLKLMDGSAGIAKASGDLYKNALSFAKAGRLDRACSMLQDVYSQEANKTSVPLNYNIGVCNEALLPDDPSKSFEYYNQADQLLTSPNKLVSEALTRSRELMQQARRIQ